MISKATHCACLVLLSGSLIQSKEYSQESKTFFLGSDRANFFKAYFNCKQGGMELASINSQEEEENLTFFLRDVDKTSGGFWLSGTNFPDVNSSQYYWLTGGTRAIYTDWLPGEPNNAGGIENCLAFSSRGHWNDYVCQNELRYICQTVNSSTKMPSLNVVAN